MTTQESAVIALTEAEFDPFAQSAALPVLADFWAPWCAPCRFLGPLFEKFAREFNGKAVFVKINRDEAPNLRERFDVQTIPRLILIQDGKPIAVEVGLAEYSHQHSRVKKMLGLEAAGRPSNREKKFRELVAAAFASYGKMVRETQEAYYSELMPLIMKARADRKSNDDALTAGTVNVEEHKAKEDEVKAQFETASSILKHLADPYNAVRVPAEILYRADVLAATDQLFPLAVSPAEALTESAISDGASCAIGDPTCSGN